MPQHVAGLGPLQALRAEQLGDPEVEQLDLRRVALDLDQEHVVGLEIAMDDAVVVCRLECEDDRLDDRERVIERDRTAGEPLAQALAAQPLHDEVVAAVGQRAEREDVDDVRVPDLVDRPRLLDEPLDRLRVQRQLRMQHLDRGTLRDHGMDRGVHPSHPACAERPLDAVLAHHHPGHQLGDVLERGGVVPDATGADRDTDRTRSGPRALHSAQA